jgi:hypothetical protein
MLVVFRRGGAIQSPQNQMALAAHVIGLGILVQSIFGNFRSHFQQVQLRSSVRQVATDARNLKPGQRIATAADRMTLVLYVTWGLWFAAVLLTSTIFNFLVGKWLRRKPTGAILSLGILLNLALLGCFKYLPEIAVRFPVSSLQRFSQPALPLGISFWTFQAMSYLFDLYRGEELVFRVCPVYGFLPGYHFWPRLPHARDAWAIPL